MKKKQLCALLVCLAIVIAAGTAALVTWLNRPEPVMADTGVKLYWNVDRDTYVGDSSAGINVRERADDGLYTVRFAVDGEQVEYRVEKARLLHKIDAMDIMGLAIDEDGIITDVFDPEDITGGEIAPGYYVVFGSDETITVSPNEDLEDDYKMLAVNENTGIYNVTGLEAVGHRDNVLPSDCVRAFQNDEEEITHVFIVSRYGYWAGETVQKTCAHCNETVDWYVWEEKYSLPNTSGHWILENNVKANIQTKLANEQQIIIDLNGNTITGKTDTRVYAMTGENTYLAFMDSSEEGTGTVIGRGSPDNGGIVLVRYGIFELFSGTLDASAIETKQYASAVRVDKKGTFNMYNGTVIGGTALGSMNEEETSTTGGYGGTIQVSGVFNLYDGVVRDGTALRYDKKNGTYTCGNGGNLHLGTNAVFNMYGGSILNGTAQRAGGNIYMGTNVVATISGGTIAGGVVTDDDRYGGNIYVHEKTQALNISGGTIKGGKTLGAGGNIALYGTMNMSGGLVTGGSCMTGKTIAEGEHNPEYPHHNVYCVGGTVNMTGGLVEGFFRIRDTAKKECTVNISGTAQIKGGTINLSLDPGDEVNFGTLKKGADIRINGGGYVSTKTASSNVNYVRSTYEGVTTQYINQKLFIGKQACVCGETGTHIGDCDGTLLDWIPWGTATSMPNLEANWYLVCDVDMKAQVKIEENAVFRLDLNGHKVIGAEDERVYALRNGGITMMVTDHSAQNTGTIITRGKDMGRGAAIWVSDNGSLKMYGGIIDGSKATSLYNGAIVCVDDKCSFAMYDGTIVGGTAALLTDSKGKTSNGFGGAVATSGVFNMHGGTIADGTAATNAGNLFVGKTGVFKFYGGEIVGGTTTGKGGNITGTGKIYLCGGALKDGTAKYGGNIFINSGTVVEMSSGEISSGTSSDNGGNVYVQADRTNGTSAGEFVLFGGTIKTGNGAQGGNIYLQSCGTKLEAGAGILTMTGGTICDGVADTAGGNVAGLGVFAMSDGNIYGGKVVADGNHQYGANLFTKPGVEGSSFKMTGGTIAGLVRAYGGEGELVLGGTAKITNTDDNTNLTLASGMTVKVVDLKSEANIGVNPEYATYFASGAKAGDEAYFTADKKYRKVELTDTDKLIIGYDWEPWYELDSLPTESGMYYLTSNVTVTAAATIEENSVMLDLMGYTVKASEEGTTVPRIYVLNEDAKLTICDSSQNGTGKMVSTRQSSSAAGGMIYLNKSGAQFILDGGTLDASGVKLTGYNGAAVCVNAGTSFTMNGGTIIGGTANQGGSVYVTKHASNPGEFIMTGGNIINGTAGTGGNICALGIFDMSGGSISGGTATGNNAATGGNIYTTPNAVCTFTISGGTIEGLVRVNSAGIITISGSAKIKGENGNHGITLTNKPARIVTKDLHADAEIYVNVDYTTYYMSNGTDFTDTQYFATVEKAEDASCFKDDNQQTVFATPDNTLILGIEWTSDTTLPTTSGYYRLTKNVTLSSAASIAADSTVYWDLNGKTITGSKKRIAQWTQEDSNATLSICDTQNGRGITVIRETGETNGNFFYMKQAGFTLNLYSGIIDGTQANTEGLGGCVYVCNGSTFNMYGGTIGKAKTTQNGGAVYVAAGGTMNMSGGIIEDCTASQGGNIYLQAIQSGTTAAGSLTLSGGTISGGTAASAGGNIAALGQFNMTGGEIKDGVSKATSEHRYGANIYTLPGKKGASFSMTGGHIAGLVRVNNAGAFTLGGTARITEGSATCNDTTTTCGLWITKEQNGATLTVDSEGFKEGAEIYLSTQNLASGTKLVGGTIAEEYQQYFKPCGTGTLEFTIKVQ